MTSKLLLQIALLFVCSKIVCAQDYPATEIYMIDIQKTGNHFSLVDGARLINVSNNKGYDNQPGFIEQLNSIAYVSSRDNKPTDVYLYDLSTGVSKQFTNNTEAEFSPKITPDGKYISVVKGGEQNLTRISLDGAVIEKLYTSKDSIGYYCWLNEDEIAAYVLSNPVILKLINIKSKTEQYLADSIGRSLYKYKDGVVICRMLHGGNEVVFADLEGRYTEWIKLPASTEDFYLTDDGWLFSSDGSKLIYCNVKRLQEGWQQLADLKGMGVSKIFRIAVNKKRNLLTFVTAEQ